MPVTDPCGRAGRFFRVPDRLVDVIPGIGSVMIWSTILPGRDRIHEEACKRGWRLSSCTSGSACASVCSSMIWTAALADFS